MNHPHKKAVIVSHREAAELPAHVQPIVKRLTAELWSTGIHGVTGQAYESGWLQPGTLVRNFTHVDGSDAWHFEASTDGGLLWYMQIAYETPEVAEVS